MWREIRNYPQDLLFAVALHVALVALLVLSLHWTPKLEPPKDIPIVQATVVDEKAVAAELSKLREQETRRQQAEEDRQRQLEREARQAEQNRRREEQRVAELQQKRTEEERRLKAEQQRRAEENERLAKIQAEKEALEKKRQAEEKRLAEIELEKRRAEENRKKAEAERKRKEEQERRRREDEEALKARVAEEQRQHDAQREREARATVAQYVEAIRQKVERNWLRPPGTAQGLSCNVVVQLIPGGDVASVRISKSSGNPSFDRSVESAVRKAAPLPLPPDPALFDRFRQIEFVFNPKN